MQFGDVLLKDVHAALESFTERGLLRLDNVGDMLRPVFQFGVGFAHDLHDGGDQPKHEGVVQVEFQPVARRPAENSPQDVTAAVVAGRDTIGNGEGQRPHVVSDDAEGVIVVVAQLGGIVFAADVGQMVNHR